MFKKNLLTSALAFALTLGLASAANAGAMSNYLTNKIIDFVIRGQTYTPPGTVYVALSTSASTPASCGTEVSGGGYARVAVSASLVGWAGTQGAGTTSQSSGTSGTTSNNTAITFGSTSPTASWGAVQSFCIFDSATGGNLLIQAGLTSTQVVNAGATPPSFAIGALTWTIN